MSLNIQTSNGLLEIGGSVTKDKVVSALGYSPANEEAIDDHVNNSVLHITAAERAKWNSGTGSGSGISNIEDDGSGELTIQDEADNAIFRVDANGMTTTKVTAKALSLNSSNITTETWTFTLEDGSTVTKVVCVG